MLIIKLSNLTINLDHFNLDQTNIKILDIILCIFFHFFSLF